MKRVFFKDGICLGKINKKEAPIPIVRDQGVSIHAQDRFIQHIESYHQSLKTRVLVFKMNDAL